MIALAGYILPVFLGLGLSAATGLRTFLPLLILAVAAHFHLFGTSLNPQADWLARRRRWSRWRWPRRQSWRRTRSRRSTTSSA
jgi:hypothetical protein